MMQILRWVTSVAMCSAWMITTPVLAEEASPNAQLPLWHYGGFVDLGYSLDFNFPENHLFRNRSTTPRVNELDLNMAGVYVRKDATTDSRWGMELMGHGGQDALNFGFGANLPKVEGSDALRHFGRANLSYLAPVGNGLTLQAGLFNSFIGYESLYAKDNFNYSRAWIADYSPYLMFGANAQYNFDDKWSGAFFIINEYFHLQNANNLPSYGAQVAYKLNRSWLFKETVYYGPDQSDTSLQFWRLFSDSIVEWKANDDLTLAGEYQVGTQEMAIPGHPRFVYMGATFQMRWHVYGPWSVALRPEVYWDPNGFQTGAEQFIRAVTTTAEYKFPYKWTNMIGRLEYRYDESTGSGGGFFKGNEIAPGVIGLTPAQHMLIFALIWTLDSP
ncbi:MAG TPA: outer membrane beta-barrel protein [Nitrospira sp.]|nr:outer membrane beta-barrel protein [Nitrospira sp.]